MIHNANDSLRSTLRLFIYVKFQYYFKKYVLFHRAICLPSIKFRYLVEKAALARKTRQIDRNYFT